MAITKPSALERFLDYINIDAGEWAHQSISFLGKHIFTLNIPPFSVGIGDWIEAAIDVTLVPINAAIDALWAAVRAIPSVLDIVGWVSWVVDNAIAIVRRDLLGAIAWATSLLWEGIRAATRDLTGAIVWTTSQLWDGINQAQKEVMEWTPGFVDSAIAAAFLPLRYPLNVLITRAKDIDDFFEDWEKFVWDRIEKILIRFW